MTGLGWLTVLFLVGFFAMLAFRLVPVYLENYSVKSVLKSFKDEPLITKQDKRKILSMVLARLNTNGVKDIKRDMVKIEQKPGILKIHIDYFVRKPMVGNIEVIITFDEEVELVSH